MILYFKNRFIIISFLYYNILLSFTLIIYVVFFHLFFLFFFLFFFSVFFLSYNKIGQLMEVRVHIKYYLIISSLFFFYFYFSFSFSELKKKKSHC